MISYKIKNTDLVNNILIPKYYDPALYEEIKNLKTSHDLFILGDLIDSGVISVQTGHEIGKMAYGTGNIPFVRTSDISNWEIKTIPKQGVSEDIYSIYADKEDIQPDDILMVRDGTYLIGTNCMVSVLDIPMIFQSHIIKFRIIDKDKLNPYLFFLSLNCSLVQRQIRNKQFTADIIDTLGMRYKEIIIPIPKDKELQKNFIQRLKDAFEQRIKYKTAIKQMPLLIEKVLDTNSASVFSDFLNKNVEDIIKDLVQDTTTLEFGDSTSFLIKSDEIVHNIFIPKYYDPNVIEILDSLSAICDLVSIKDLSKKGIISLDTGDEIGKMAYGTGNIPFVRTSDFSNWEIKTDTKQGISEEIYSEYADKQDIKPNDILIVRDGTYLIGTSCIITESDSKMLYCGGLIKIRCIDNIKLNPYLLFGILNSYIVKRQIRTKQFTRDVIDTIGKRFDEVIIPIPKNNKVKDSIIDVVNKIIMNRIAARDEILTLSSMLCN